MREDGLPGAGESTSGLYGSFLDSTQDTGKLSGNLGGNIKYHREKNFKAK